MAVGPHLTKFTYLVGPVTVIGVVDSWIDGNLGVTDDGFGLKVDPIYANLPAAVPASTGHLHCETYPIDGSQTNHVPPWNLPMKPVGQPFTVLDPATGQRRQLQLNDHIEIMGVIVIENGHPQNDTMRGALRIGQVFLEMHPFDYTNLRLVDASAQRTMTRASVLAVAPLYEMVYTGQWVANEIAGVADHLFIGDDGGLFHDSNSATADIAAPPKPASPANVKLAVTERVLINGTGQPIDHVRTLVTSDEGVHVQATVSVPATQVYSPVTIADVNGPAAGKGVLVLDYELTWQPPEGTPAGLLLHTTRFVSTGAWAPEGDVHGQIGNAGPVQALGATSATGGLAEFMMATDDGHLWHTLHRNDGSWSGLGDVFGQIQNPGPVRAVAATSASPGLAEFMMATEDGHLWHTMRHTDTGAWSGLGDVFAQITSPGPVRAVAATSASPGLAEFMMATEDGHLWHTMRHTDTGAWSGLGDVFAQITSPGPVRAVAATSASPGLAEFMMATEDGHLWHTMRHTDTGAWSGLGDVFGQIQNPGPVRAVAATSASPGLAEFLFATEDGHLWHTMRHTDTGAWSGLGDVFGQIQNPGPVRAVAATSAVPDQAQFIFAASTT